jgi:hypothetical protein
MTVAAAMIDRLVRHAEVVSLKGFSYRLKVGGLGRTPSDDTASTHRQHEPAKAGFLAARLSAERDPRGSGGG